MNSIHCGDCIEVMRGMDAGVFNCCVTSPPYYGLRDYGHDGQIGLEKTPDEYVARLVDVFREVRRVLRDDGTLWLNLGDSYANMGSNGKRQIPHGVGRPAETDRYAIDRVLVPTTATAKSIPVGLKPKDILGIPWRVAFALQEDGWYLRSDIIWHKTNAMPSSVKDRPTSAHEYIFLLTKRPKYYYDHESVMETAVSTSKHRFVDKDDSKQRGHSRRHAGFNGRYAERIERDGVPTRRNLRDVWPMATANFAEAHFAVFPDELARRCILAGCPEGGTVFDPFLGSGTTVMVAQQLGRQGAGVELNPEYIKLATQRTAQMGLC